VTPPAPVVDIPTALAKALAAIKVTGKAKVGKTLTVANLDLDLRTAVTYKFQWFAGTKKIKKATKSKLKVLKSMKGKKISVKVTGTAGSASKSLKGQGRQGPLTPMHPRGRRSPPLRGTGLRRLREAGRTFTTSLSIRPRAGPLETYRPNHRPLRLTVLALS
jgi:hypothetical protein